MIELLRDGSPLGDAWFVFCPGFSVKKKSSLNSFLWTDVSEGGVGVKPRQGGSSVNHKSYKHCTDPKEPQLCPYTHGRSVDHAFEISFMLHFV